MERWREPDSFRRACTEARARGETVGLVPTMGALHAGHVALLAEARRRTSFVVASIFVNPTQFGPNEDYARYPRTEDADAEKCRAAGASGVFVPDAAAMYSAGDETRVRVGATATELCGAFRPGHFEGVATVVTKLFALSGPCVAVFGRKDYQQLRVIARLAGDLLLPVEVVGLRTVREKDGLALSSRNAYLDADQRAAALSIPRGLSAAVRAFEGGERRAGELVAIAREGIAVKATSIDYVAIADPDSIRVHGEGAEVGPRALLAVAARFGGARLIDNVVLGEDPAPIAEHATRAEGGAT